MNENKLIILGNILPMCSNKIHQRNFVYSLHGIAPTLTATMYKDPPRILEFRGGYKEIINLGNFYGHGASFAGNLYYNIGIAPTITACISHGGMGLIVLKER